ncbi:hypothetical protein E5843_08380 [Luteimonas yindakuii]|uniref:hypothetical protein n=1 Tax=Luteimonas yindakuii TaxID=2565782 RepID=UPI0011076898|nr:hypothetical protein [Luteimonas yindakuii]QCO67782.2 hypothetical protein E5843_08380 [Luteimonas yindakuii]
MTTIQRTLLMSVLLACTLPLAACSADPADTGAGTSTEAADEGLVARTTRTAIEHAREEMATANIGVGGKGNKGINFGSRSHAGSDALPSAEISPQGDFLIDGEPVPVDDSQRALLLAHRAHVIAVADAGMEIGAQGAALGLQAASGAIGAVLRGDGEAFGKRMEAEGERIEAAAGELCTHLPALLQSQQALAAALPAFEPYATMTAEDVDSCDDKTRRDGDSVSPQTTGNEVL